MLFQILNQRFGIGFFKICRFLERINVSLAFFNWDLIRMFFFLIEFHGEIIIVVIWIVSFVDCPLTLLPFGVEIICEIILTPCSVINIFWGLLFSVLFHILHLFLLNLSFESFNLRFNLVKFGKEVLFGPWRVRCFEHYRWSVIFLNKLGPVRSWQIVICFESLLESGKIYSITSNYRRLLTLRQLKGLLSGKSSQILRS